MLGGIQIVNQRSDGYGGTLTRWPENIMRQASESFFINADSQVTKYVVGGNRIIWFASLYLHKKSRKDMLDTFSKIQDLVPEKEWCKLLLAGDWNIDLNDHDDKVTQSLQIIIKQMGLKTFHSGPTRGNHIIDYIVTGSDIKLSNIQCKQNHVSDHSIILADLEIPKPKVSNDMMIPDRKKADYITA